MSRRRVALGGCCLAAATAVALGLLLGRQGGQLDASAAPPAPPGAIAARCALRASGVNLTFVGAGAATTCRRLSNGSPRWKEINGAQSAPAKRRAERDAMSKGEQAPDKRAQRETSCLMTSPDRRLLLVVQARERGMVAARRMCVLFAGRGWHDDGRPESERGGEDG